MDESPELFRKKARIRMTNSSAKFYTMTLEDGTMEQIPTAKKSKESSRKKPKSMLIVHSDEDVEATQHMNFVDPNSKAYQNAVLEHKINK